jgi:gluconate 2-dehydrogenase gamma chain
MTTFISRRDLLKRAIGAAAAVPVARAFEASEAVAAERPTEAAERSAEAFALQAPLESLTASEMELLNAVAARLIPNDANGPGAVEAGVTRYIDRALAGALSSSRQAYAAGLTALDNYAQSSRGKAFRDLSPTDQDSVLIDVETGAATGFTGSSAQFFAMVLGHTHQGMFGDPYYGGNKDFAGWDLIRYPGVRTMVTATDQTTLEAHQLKPNHKSAYDYDAFTKADPKGPHARLPRVGEHHGD